MDVDFIAFDFKCAVCGRTLSLNTLSMCHFCDELLCSDHLVVKNGVTTCHSCVTERERRESSSRVSAEDLDRVVTLLRADVAATIGRSRVRDDMIAEEAAERRSYVDDPVWYVESVVSEVQQYFHDTFEDTTWPACPHHPNHPLWFSQGSWRCDRLKEPVAALGELSKIERKA
jgi:hypothetical protein